MRWRRKCIEWSRGGLKHLSFSSGNFSGRVEREIARLVLGGQGWELLETQKPGAMESCTEGPERGFYSMLFSNLGHVVLPPLLVVSVVTGEERYSWNKAFELWKLLTLNSLNLVCPRTPSLFTNIRFRPMFDDRSHPCLWCSYKGIRTKHRVHQTWQKTKQKQSNWRQWDRD